MRRLLLLTLVPFALSCGAYDLFGASPSDGGEEEEHADASSDAGNETDAGDEADAGDERDGGSQDGGSQDEGCTDRVSTDQFCSRHGTECGSLTKADECGVEHTVECGGCGSTAGIGCGLGGVAGVCACRPEAWSVRSMTADAPMRQARIQPAIAADGAIVGAYTNNGAIWFGRWESSAGVSRIDPNIARSGASSATLVRRPDGFEIVVWVHADEGLKISSRSATNGAWSTVDAEAGSQLPGGLRVSANAAGDVVAAWSSSSSVVVARITGDGLLLRTALPSSQLREFLSVAADPSGKAWALWVGTDGQLKVSSGATPEVLGAAQTGALAFDASGTPYVVEASSTGTRLRRRLPSGWTSEAIDAMPAGEADITALLVDGRGDVIVGGRIDGVPYLVRRTSGVWSAAEIGRELAGGNQVMLLRSGEHGVVAMFAAGASAQLTFATHCR